MTVGKETVWDMVNGEIVHQVTGRGSDWIPAAVGENFLNVIHGKTGLPNLVEMLSLNALTSIFVSELIGREQIGFSLETAWATLPTRPRSKYKSLAVIQF